MADVLPVAAGQNRPPNACFILIKAGNFLFHRNPNIILRRVVVFTCYKRFFTFAVVKSRPEAMSCRAASTLSHTFQSRTPRIRPSC